MPAPTQGRLFDSIGQGGISIEVTLLVLAAIVLLLFWGCKKKSNQVSPSPVSPEAGQEVRAASTPPVGREAEEGAYDSAFIKFLAAPTQPVPPTVVPGLRKISVPAESLRGYSPSGGQAQSGSYEITLDISHQILGLDVPEDREYGSRGSSLETPLYPSFAEANTDGSFTSAAALALKAKQFDDGLYACVEIAADAGLDRFPGRKGFLLDLLKGLSQDSDRSAAALLTAAARLGGQQPEVSAEIARQAQDLQAAFLADELRSKPLAGCRKTPVLT
ncbi:MAG: hypothetical protein ACLQVL_20325 [Terriglobia bacterium]